MELEVLRHTGIPESGIISIRAGSTRRQAQLCCMDRPMKFPQKPEECATFKVDVLDLLGSARLAYNPDQNEYSLALESPVDGGDPPNMEVAFRILRPGEPYQAPTQAPAQATAASAPPPPDEKALDKKKEVAAREYLEKHGLTSFMQFLMQSLMKDKPSDPYSFLQKQVTKRMVTEVSRAVIGDNAEVLPDGKVETLLNQYSPEVTQDQLQTLEKEAAAASDQLRADNEKLRQTADMLKSKYGKLIEETAELKTEAALPEVPRLELPPKREDETPQMAAYREIAAMQDDVTSLARENATLVSQLTSMRLSIEAVRDEIEMMNQDTPHGRPSPN